MSTSAGWLLAIGVIVLLFSLGSSGGGAAAGALFLAAAVIAQARANQRTAERLAKLESWVHEHWARTAAAARAAQSAEKPAEAPAATPQIPIRAPKAVETPAPATSTTIAVPPKPAPPPAPQPAVQPAPQQAPPVPSRIAPASPPAGPAPIKERRPEPVVAKPAAAAAVSLPAPIRPQARPTPPPAPRRSLLDIEQILGVNWLSKIGVGILVIGVAFFLAWQLRQMGPLGKDVVGITVGIALLAMGVWGERKERYQILSRASIAGGWSLLYFISYAAYHVDAARVIRSPAVALLLMFAVAAGMVSHTLRYRSQVVTGLAFVLAFVTIALNRADVTSLSANLVLAAGFSFVVLRMRWYRLECAGIVAAYLNHYLWLRSIVEPMEGSLRPFAAFGTSATILILQWAIFRLSFVVRRPPDERASVFAGMLNTALLLVVMRYQSADPLLGFWLLLILGAAELALARLPRMRARRSSFVALTAAGGALLASASPFRFGPADVTPIWVINAVVFTTVGVVMSERVYRRLGSILMVATSVQLLTGPAAHLFTDRAAGGPREWFIGIVGLLIGSALYADSAWLPRRWPALFEHSADRRGARLAGYLGVGMAMFAAWAIFPGDVTSSIWAALAVALALLHRRISDNPDVPIQVAVVAVAAFWVALLAVMPATPSTSAAAAASAERAATVLAVAALLYVLARLNARWSGFAQLATHFGGLWAATALLVLLTWQEVTGLAVGLVWTAMAVALSWIGRRFATVHLSLQANTLALLVAVRVLVVHLPAGDLLLRSPWPVTWRLVAALAAAALFYALSRWNRATSLGADNQWIAGPQWIGTTLLVLLPAFELRSIALSFGWTALALALAIAGRRFAQPHLLLQSNLVLAIAVARLLLANLGSDEAAITAPFAVSWLFMTVVAAAIVLYILSWWNRAGALTSTRPFAAAPMWTATALLVMLAWLELVSPAVVLVWTMMAFVAAAVGRRFRVHDLLMQGNVITFLGILRILEVNLPSNALAIGSVSWRVVTVPLLAALAYLLGRWNDAIAERVANAAGKRFVLEAPVWAGTGVLVLLSWYQLVPASVAVAWTILAVILLEIGIRRSSSSLLLQAYLLLFASVARLFVANMNIDTGPGFGPRIYTIVPIVIALLHVHRRLDAVGASSTPRWLQPAFARLAALPVAALLRFELAADAVAPAWAAGAVVAAAAGALSGRRGFMHISVATAFATLARAAMHNLYERSYFPSLHEYDRWLYVGATALLLLASLPFAFRARTPHAEVAAGSLARRAVRWIDTRPEQFLFFIPLALITALIATETGSGLLTLALGVEAFAVFVFAVWVGERSFRLAGMGLLLVCIGKIFILDFWSLSLRDKSLTGIVLGLALIGVSLLYTRKRETLLRYL